MLIATARTRHLETFIACCVFSTSASGWLAVLVRPDLFQISREHSGINSHTAFICAGGQTNYGIDKGEPVVSSYAVDPFMRIL
jgi:hypothetical protein